MWNCCNAKLRNQRMFYKIETGTMEHINFKGALEKGESIKKNAPVTEM